MFGRIGHMSSLAIVSVAQECPSPFAIATEHLRRPPSERPLRVAVAGTTCTDHSAMGFLV